MITMLYENIHLNDETEKKVFINTSHLSVETIVFSLYFFDEEFYTDVPTFNNQENVILRWFSEGKYNLF